MATGVNNLLYTTFLPHYGKGYEVSEIPSPETHIQDCNIRSYMTNYGIDYDNVVVSGQVTEDRVGYQRLLKDNDGYVSSLFPYGTNLTNPNCSVESQPLVTFINYSYK